MDRTYFCGKLQRDASLVAIGFFGLMIGVTLFLLWHEPRRPGSDLAVAMPFFWLVWLALSVHALAVYYCGFLRIGNQDLQLRGALLSSQIRLDDVQRVDWGRRFRKQVRLNTTSGNVQISLDWFDPDHRLEIVEFLRERWPEELQEGWQMFCHKVALPLIPAAQQRAKQERINRPGTVLITRQRWDGYMLSAIAVTAIIGGVAAWAVARPQLAFGCLTLIPLWLFLRFITPRDGMISEQLVLRLSKAELKIDLLIWVTSCILGLMITWLWAAFPDRGTTSVILILSLYPVTLHRALLATKRQREEDARNSIESELEWELLHGDVQ